MTTFVSKNSDPSLRALKSAKILVIGSGLMAAHWSHYLDLLGVEHYRWSRRESSTDALKAFLDQNLHSSKPIEMVFMAISDSALEPFYQQHLKTYRLQVLHFSGALDVEGIISVHPLMSFGPQLYNLVQYQAIPLVTSSEIQLSFLPNRIFRISPQERARYHALCVIAGNFSVMIWQKFFFEMEKYGLPISACLPYFRQINANIEAFPFSALTGPLMRNDIKTMELNMHSLHGDAFRDVYKHMVHAFEVQLKGLQQPRKDPN